MVSVPLVNPTLLMDLAPIPNNISQQTREEVNAFLSTISKRESALIQPLTLDADVIKADEIAALIDHTLLKPDAKEAAVRELCAEAMAYGFASVCVNLTWLPLCRELLAETAVKTCVVIGFPLGATSAAAKAFEATEAVKQGVDEVDMVINVGHLKDQAYSAVYEDIAGVVKAAHAKNVLLKVIIETALLSDDEKVAGCLIAKAAGADFVKTSTGFNGGGATVDDIRLMRQSVGPVLGVKASGGVRTADDARAMVSAGATRIGASAGVAIVKGFLDHAPAEIEQKENGQKENENGGDTY